MKTSKGGGVMERLTERGSYGYGDVYVRRNDYVTASKKLCEYEELEEQGLLLKLPVPIGTTVYEFEPLNKIVKGCTTRTVIKYTVYDDSIWFNFADGYMKDIKDFGKTVFLTQDEAEQKLKEMESD